MEGKREFHYLIQRIRQDSGDVRTYFLHWGLQPLAFLPGQFCNVRLAAQPDRVGALTFCSAPGLDEFALSVKNTGDFGAFFYQQAEVGAAVKTSAPTGPFALRPEHVADPLVVLARDYCLPALRSFLEWLRTQGMAFDLTLYHELLDGQPGLYAEELEAWQDHQFRVHRLDRPLEPQDLSGHLKSRFFAQAEGSDARRYRDLLLKLHIPVERTHIERWS